MNKRTNKTTTKNIYPLHNAKFLREYNNVAINLEFLFTTFQIPLTFFFSRTKILHGEQISH